MQEKLAEAWQYLLLALLIFVLALQTELPVADAGVPRGALGLKVFMTR